MDHECKKIAGFADFNILLKPDSDDVAEHNRLMDRVCLILPDTKEINQLVEERSKIARNQVIEKMEEKTRSKRNIPKNDEASELKDESVDVKKSTDVSNEVMSDCSQNLIKIMSDEQIKKLKEGILHVTDYRQGIRDKYIHERLKLLGTMRQVASEKEISSALGWLDAISEEQPHFSEVINFVKGFLSLAIAGQQLVTIPPILILGPPGIGKTHFTKSLAKAMSRPVIIHSLDSDHTSNMLTGSDRHWSNTKTGIVFDSVCMQKRCDPIILLDEIDKAHQSTERDSLSPLHGLLEPLTAKSTTDISIEIEFDASHIFWIATANEKSRISKTILSRFKIFSIETPSAEQAICIAKSTAAYVQNKFDFMDYPSREVITCIAHLTPREQIQALERAFAAAVLAGRKFIRVSDIDKGINPDLPLLH
jgi:ATP-dependent Lon protease